MRQADSKVQAADLYLYAAGELFSETLHRGFLHAAAETSPSLLARLTQQEGDYVKNLDKLETLARCVQDGQTAKAMDIYARLPQSLKKEKSVLLLRVQAAQSLDLGQLDAAIRDFRSAFPHDPVVNRLLIDTFFLHQEYAKARASIDRLDRSLGGDPYLNVLRANAYLAEKQYKTAKELLPQSHRGRGRPQVRLLQPHHRRGRQGLRRDEPTAYGGAKEVSRELARREGDALLRGISEIAAGPGVAEDAQDQN